MNYLTIFIGNVLEGKAKNVIYVLHNRMGFSGHICSRDKEKEKKRKCEILFTRYFTHCHFKKFYGMLMELKNILAEKIHYSNVCGFCKRRCNL